MKRSEGLRSDILRYMGSQIDSIRKESLTTQDAIERAAAALYLQGFVDGRYAAELKRRKDDD